MSRHLLLLLSLLWTSLVHAQTPFDTFNEQALRAYKAKNYAESGKLFDQAMQQKGAAPTSTDYYNAGCSWALAGNSDKAFGYLEQSVLAGWDDAPHFRQDRDLASLHADKRWQPLVAKLEAADAQRDVKLNQPLKRRLGEIYITDQLVRSKVDSVQKNFGMKSPQWESLMKEMRTIDARNKELITAMIDQYGWPGKSLVGATGSLTAFLVIQHSDLATQLKYLPLMREAAAKGELAKSSLALVEDRVLVGQGKPQRYGSQLRTNKDTGKTEFFPIEDEAHVDERRASVNLGKLAEYAKLFGLEYTPPKN